MDEDGHYQWTVYLREEGGYLRSIGACLDFESAVKGLEYYVTPPYKGVEIRLVKTWISHK